jgi:hypothetical protein
VGNQRKGGSATGAHDCALSVPPAGCSASLVHRQCSKWHHAVLFLLVCMLQQMNMTRHQARRIRMLPVHMSAAGPRCRRGLHRCLRLISLAPRPQCGVGDRRTHGISCTCSYSQGTGRQVRRAELTGWAASHRVHIDYSRESLQ